MNFQPQNRSGRVLAQTKYAAARTNLLMVVIFTTVNILLSAMQTNVYFLFAADIPFFVTGIGQTLYLEFQSLPLLIVFSVIGVVLSLPYLVCWKFSKNHYGWMIGALVYFAFDCALLLVLFLLSLDPSLLIDLAFHTWVLYYLIIGVKFGKQLKELPAQDPLTADTAETAFDAQTTGYEATPTLENTVALRIAGDEEKSKVYLQATVGTHTIVYRKYGKHTEELVVDGQVYAEYVFRGPVAKPNTLTAVVDGMQIAAGYYQKNYIIVNNELVAESIRWT